MEYWDGLLKTPYYLVDETLLKQNLEILRGGFREGRM